MTAALAVLALTGWLCTARYWWVVRKENARRDRIGLL